MRKKTPQSKANKGTPKKDQYTVVLEDLRSQFKVFGEGLMGLNHKVEGGFKEINKKLGEHSMVLDKHGKTLDRYSETLDSHTQMIGQILMDLAEVKHDLKHKVDRQEFARLEKRVIMLERKVK